jgi:peptide/nickel transport system substrate-binding protein
MIFAWINMKDKTKLGLTITLLAIICSTSLFAFVSATGPATDTIEYVRVDRPLAPDALRNGDIDVYIFDILPEAQIEIGTEDPDIEFWEGISGMQCIALNPAPAPDGELNPFSITEVRYAMNFIFDRDFIVDEIYKGTAAKMYDYLGPYHPEVPTVADIKLTHGFVYDFEIANDMVENSMVLAGAEKRAGKWYYRDNPVTIKAMIRVEDERRDMGDMFAAELEKLGFTIDYIHTTFGPAIDTIYGTDPAAFEWSFYTEGFGLGASRWNTWEPGCWGGSADPDIGDWCANMPGWGVEEWWNYISPGARVEILSTDIYYGRYDDTADREEKIREVTDLMMQESVRIFGIRQLTAYPARRDVMGLTQDMGQGLRGAVWTPREAYRPGDDTLTFANLWVWTESTNWNLYGGFNDVYSVDIARSTYDMVVWRHPFTASAMPFRADYEVETEGPDGVLDVPSDAYTWDADGDAWTAVGAGVNATSKVSYDMSNFLGTNWQHGVEQSWADFIYFMASGWDFAEDEAKSAREPEVRSATQGFYSVVKGVKIVGDELEVYIDYYHFDLNEIAFFSNPFGNSMAGIGQNPWESMAAQEDAALVDELLALSTSSSDVLGLPEMSLVLGTHAGYVADSLAEFIATNYFPASWFTMGDTVYETAANAQARYQAAIDWYDEYGILWIGNGPYMMTRFDAEAQYAETKAFRDPTYPYSAGDWYYGRPAIPEVVDVSVPTVTKGVAATIEILMVGPENLEATYIITEEATGMLVLKDEASTTATWGTLEARLTTEDTDALDIGGRYVLTVLGKSPDVAFLSENTKRFVVRDPLIVGLGETVEEITGTIDTLSGRLDDVSVNLASAIDALSELIGTTTDDLSEELSDSIGSVTQAISDTNTNINKLAGSTSTMLYAIVATLLVALAGAALTFTKKS